ncbi:UDP-N-acetylmuramoyl-L-alanyl-D-glutamate--2,6-diaminopimelate ligase [Schaalia suimastitidis]|uniref:UDP-N-acetylmuramoyl-L-alanyl-D-glutamate--2, 6-diaminopimelate ligase n=1 Tax=Schaalia suimastitidis TaxID=121163 RepID=UPI00042260B1|nr:UDP-N-acetylmuramoyl-L-alanyl-D-glutamate--2,6-diaminopimelate ligase [Schaalia suimastitidis]
MTSVLDIRPSVSPVLLRDALAEMPKAQLVNPSEEHWNTHVTGVSVNSRDIDNGWIFVAIPGMKQHGIEYARGALTRGAVAIVTDQAGADRAHRYLAEADIPVVVVDDPRLAAARIAHAVYRNPAAELFTMAITGTNGKTTTSYLMRSIIRTKYPQAALCGTVQTHVGPVEFSSDNTTAESPVIYRFLSLARQENCGAAIVETSSHALSLDRVDGIVFDVAGFTNLQHDHLDYHGDMGAYFEAKRLLFTPAHAKQGVVCVDDEWGQRLANEAEIPVTTVSALSDAPANWRVSGIRVDTVTQATLFTLTGPDARQHTVSLPIAGQVNVQNAAVAILSAVVTGFDIDEVIAALAHADQVPGRMEMLNPGSTTQPLVIVDFAHTTEALAWTIETVREFVTGKLVLVFGTDGDRDASKREELAALAARKADYLWVTDENPRTENPQSIRDYLLRGIASVRPDMSDVVEITTCRRDAVRKAILHAQVGDVVLITGKGAEWYQDIDGIKHVYNDVPVALEVLAQDPRTGK